MRPNHSTAKEDLKMPSESFLDEILSGFGNAVDDIRTKVLEEPYFGRAVTDGQPEVNLQVPEAYEQMAPEVEAPEQSPEPEIER
jgi:hypothetical protein